ncbi:MAG: mechanosensitive ion channel domain-containing protein [Arenicellales bacterium]
MIESIQTTAVLIRELLAEIFRLVPDLGASISALLVSSSPTGSIGWHALQLIFGAVFAAIGILAKRYVESWGYRQFEYLFHTVPRDRAEKIAYLLSRTLLQFVGVCIMFAVSAALAIIFHHNAIQRADFLLPVSLVTLIFLSSTIFQNLLAPNLHSHRLLAIEDGDAQRLYRWLISIFAIGLGVFLLVSWLGKLGLEHDANSLLRVLATFLGAVLLSSVALVFRSEISTMFRGGDSQGSKGLQLLTNTWHVLAVLYFFTAWTVTSIRVLLDLPPVYGLTSAPMVALLIALFSYSVMLLIIDFFDRRKQITASRISLEGEGDRFGSELTCLFERGATVLSWTAAIVYVFWVWGINLSVDGFLVNSMDILLVCFGGWFAYRVISILVSQKIEREGGITVAAPGEEGGGHDGVSRIAMLLSLFRKFLLVTVSVIVGLIVLSELGVNIGPLFAGAGVVGLAVGFGAQTLVRDIFSGAFFLMDDAFRIGEYIDVGTAKGTVEKISIRSMQLRHHMGPLNTVPFGEITVLKNFVRDWVMMKLKLRVTYDTDIEKVRKLVKKLGQELLEHPAIGHLFLQPLKSQGVYSMEDENALIIRVKFMTRPGDQFETRKVVYQEICNLFEREGIKFANKREVIVRVAEDEEGHSDMQVAAMGGAAADATRSTTPSPNANKTEENKK